MRNLSAASLLLFISIQSFSLLSHAEEKIVFVQAQTTTIKKEAKPQSEVVAQVNRGDELKILATQGLWLQVQIKNQTGWISKILTSPNKPIGQADLLSNSRVNSDAKTSRRRSNEYAVSAATRGLTATERNRNSLNKQRSDRQAVTDLDKIKIENTEVEKFKKEGQAK